jgi:cytochrome c oxidase assembly protein subunit 15
MANDGLRRWAVLVALATFALLIAGGLVTSNDAALSVPDWPLSWGRLVPPMEGGIRYEFAHRVLAATVGVLIAIQAFRMQARERRPWMRTLAWTALAAVLTQAALGGAVVKLVDPRALSIAHACLAQLCFGLTVAVAVGQHRSGLEAGGAGKSAIPSIAVAAIFAQTILGAAVRHNAIGLAPHVAGAVLATALVMGACLGILVRDVEDAVLRRSAMLLLMLTAGQIFLGLAAYTAREAAAGDPQPMAVTIWATVAHVAVGALAFGAAIGLAMIVGTSGAPPRINQSKQHR